MRAFSHPVTREARRERGARLRLPRTTSLANVRRTRSGVALVLFALLVFGIMGIMAAAIDVGVASLTQAQMQNAVDTAALEGMRMRNLGNGHELGDRNRRPQVSELVQMVFDDNLHPTGGVKPTPWPPLHGGLAGMPPDGPDQLNLGAGPVWDVPPGEGPGNVGETYNQFPRVYDDPVLEVNTSNHVDGDMISGTYALVPGNLTWNQLHQEQPDYSRPDFTPATSLPESQQDISFLVRMRRSNETPIPGEFSAAPALPYLFGLGSMIMATDGSSPTNPRTDGITVRAVAIASARPVMTIGRTPDTQDLDGNPMLGIGFWYTTTGSSSLRMLAPPTALTRDFWVETLQPQPHVPVNLTESSGALSYNGTVVGTFIAGGTGISVGMPIVAAAAPQSVPPTTYPVVFPIEAQISDGGSTSTNRVIGFGYGTIKYNGAAWVVSLGFQNDENNGTLCSLFVALGNASARMSTSLPPLSTTERNNLLAAYFDFGYTTGGTISFNWQDVRPGTLLAPVLVR
jgi:hypothetical protein